MAAGLRRRAIRTVVAAEFVAEVGLFAESSGRSESYSENLGGSDYGLNPPLSRVGGRGDPDGGLGADRAVRREKLGLGVVRREKRAAGSVWCVAIRARSDGGLGAVRREKRASGRPDAPTRRDVGPGCRAAERASNRCALLAR